MEASIPRLGRNYLIMWMDQFGPQQIKNSPINMTETFPNGFDSRMILYYDKAIEPLSS